MPPSRKSDAAPPDRAPAPWPGVAALALAGLLFAWTPLAERADLFALDLSFRALRAAGPKSAPDDIVIVGLDEASEKAIGEPIALWHAPLGEALAKIASARPKAIGLDVALPEKSFDPIRPGLDLALARGLAAARAVEPFVVALAVDGQGEAKRIHTPFLAVIDERRMGLALFGRDVDGVTRRYLLALPTQDGAFPTFAGRLCAGLAKDCRAGITDYALGAPYRYVSLARVLELNDAADLARHFGDRIVLVGETQRFTDRIAQPLNLAGWEPAERTDAPGVVAHAQALRTAIHGTPIAPAHPATLVFLLSACALLFAIRDWRLALAAGALATAGLLAGSMLLLHAGTHVPVAAALLTVFVAMAARAALDAFAYRRARDRLARAFGGYVSPPVLEGILAGRIEPGHRAATRSLAFLFADLRGSTAFAEKATPAEAMALLNRFHEVAVAAVHRHDGFLDNIRGDGVMAVFGAPKAIDDPAGAAFRAADDLLRGIDHLNAQRAKRGEPPLEVGIGLAAGEGVVGHVGSRDRFNFTAVADAANVAARLQDEARRLGFRAVLSGAVREKAGAASLEPLGNLPLRGHEPVEAWGWKGP
jgi:class 3 adenylate cyclase